MPRLGYTMQTSCRSKVWPPSLIISCRSSRNKSATSSTCPTAKRPFPSLNVYYSSSTNCIITAIALGAAPKRSEPPPKTQGAWTATATACTPSLPGRSPHRQLCRPPRVLGLFPRALSPGCRWPLGLRHPGSGASVDTGLCPGGGGGT